MTTKSKAIPVIVHERDHEPTAAQKEAGNYKVKRRRFCGMDVSVENPAGSYRRGQDPGGGTWETRMLYDYGYIRGTLGVDGDHVDCYLGPNEDAPMVYVIHQRCYGDWGQFDEDKCMLGFDSQEDAEAAYLKHYDDPRFLGPVTAMPMAEFKEKVMATKDAPQMIKGMPLILKAHVKGHTRRLKSGKVVQVKPYQNKVNAKPQAKQGNAGDSDKQIDMFAGGGAEKPAKAKKYYVTMFRETKHKPAWLAGPFDSHEDAKAHVDIARKKAEEVDPRSVFDSFGTSGLTADKHPPGVLNEHLGMGKAPKTGVKYTGGDAMDDYWANSAGESVRRSGEKTMKKSLRITSLRRIG